MTAPPGLFEALGGRAGVEALVGALYDRLERDPELDRLFRSRRAGERDRLSEFFETIFGGEVRGTRDVGMQRRHLHRFIGEAESELWLAHFHEAMVSLGMESDTRATVMGMLRGPAHRLTNAGAPRAVLERALTSAAKGDLPAVAEMVRLYPALINQRGRDGVTVLWTAARRGHLPLAVWLVNAGADVDIPGSPVHAKQVMVSPFCIAVRSGRIEVAQHLRAHGSSFDVFAAAYLGDLTALATYIGMGQANLQSRDEDFHPVTPLHHAVDGGCAPAVRLLLENGANASTSGGRLLTSAANQGSFELVQLLLRHGARAEEAESLGPVGTDSSIGALLVKRGFDLDAPIRGQETLLTGACRADKGQHAETVAALLDLGADPNAPNAKGHTPLERATSAGFTGVVELLLKAGAH